MYLSVNHLSKWYGDYEALRDITFEVKEGELLAVLGPSGCGKSTLLRCLGGFEPVQSGDIYLNHERITDLPPELRPVATVFQSYGLFPHMTVLENVKYGLKFLSLSRQEATKKALAMLERVELAQYAHQAIHDLSGGQQQRVALARSLVIEPDLLLLNEPLSNLDAKLRVSMREEIKRIQQDLHITTIFVTHDQEEAFSMADTILLMNQGNVVQTGSAIDIYEHPAEVFVLDFIGKSNLLAENCYVRPEKIRMGLPTKNQPAQGEICQVVFKGEIIEYDIHCFDGSNLSVVTLNQSDYLFQVGTKVCLSYTEKTLGG